jgi:nucleoside 2-deoxyribosyltransferase
VTELDPALLAREGEGAVQVDLPIGRPLLVMLAGPIKIWWADGMWDHPAHDQYTEWRDAVRVACIKAGFLVYSPHRAWQGAWNEAAQLVNDKAIEVADVMLDLTPDGIPAEGTDAETAYASAVGTPVVAAPPADGTALAELIERVSAYRPTATPAQDW